MPAANRPTNRSDAAGSKLFKCPVAGTLRPADAFLPNNAMVDCLEFHGTSRPLSLTVFFPAYNDAQSIPKLVRRTFEILAPLTDDFAVVVVNDGSRDDTGAVLESLCEELGPRMRVVTHARNRGYGGALRSGFGAADKEFVFYTDGDGQYDVGELPKLLEKMQPRVGLVNGYKLMRSDPLHRIWIGSVYNRFARWLFRIPIRDIDCDFRLIRRSLLDRIRLVSTSGTICIELVKKIQMSGCEIREVPVNHYPRQHGRSQFFRWRSLWTTFRQLLALYVHLVFFRGGGKVAGQ